jgi:hypothetical protein
VESTATTPDLQAALQTQTFHHSFADTVAALSDSEIVGICDSRWMQDQRLRSAGQPGIPICPEKSLGGDESSELGGLFKGVTRSKDAILSSYLRETYDKLSRAKELSKPFQVYVYAHTHVEELPHTVRTEWAITVVNTGAWQRVVNATGLERIRLAKRLERKDVLTKVTLKDLPACFSLVIIQPYQDVPDPEVEYWRQSEDVTWDLNARCPGRSD